jgi:hypothetical protein
MEWFHLEAQRALEAWLGEGAKINGLGFLFVI